MKYIVKPEKPLISGITGSKQVVLFWHTGDSVAQNFRLSVYIVSCKQQTKVQIPAGTSVYFSLLRDYNDEFMKDWTFTDIPEDGVFTLTITPEESRKFARGLYRIETKMLGTYYVPTQEDFEGIIPEPDTSIKIDNTYMDSSNLKIDWKPDVFTIGGMAAEFVDMSAMQCDFVFGKRITIPLLLYVKDSYITKDSTAVVTINNIQKELQVHNNHVLIFLSTDSKTTQFIIKFGDVDPATGLLKEDRGPIVITKMFEWCGLILPGEYCPCKYGTQTTEEETPQSFTNTSYNYAIQLSEDLIVRSQDCRSGLTNTNLLVGLDFYAPVEIPGYVGRVKVLGDTPNTTIDVLLNTRNYETRGRTVAVINIDTDTMQTAQCPEDLCFANCVVDLEQSTKLYYLSVETFAGWLNYQLDVSKINYKDTDVLTKPTVECAYWKNCAYNRDFTVCPICTIRENSSQPNFVKEGWGMFGAERYAMVGD